VAGERVHVLQLIAKPWKECTLASGNKYWWMRGRSTRSPQIRLQKPTARGSNDYSVEFVASTQMRKGTGVVRAVRCNSGTVQAAGEVARQAAAAEEAKRKVAAAALAAKRKAEAEAAAAVEAKRKADAAAEAKRKAEAEAAAAAKAAAAKAALAKWKFSMAIMVVLVAVWLDSFIFMDESFGGRIIRWMNEIDFVPLTNLRRSWARRSTGSS
jgi:hypothetical protein